MDSLIPLDIVDGTFTCLRLSSKRFLIVVPPTGSDKGEALRYRTAIIGALIGLILILAFCVKAGMSLWFAVLFFVVYFAMSVTITRIRAELGPPAHDLYNAGPDLLLTDTFGTRRIGNRNLSVMSLLDIITS